MTVCIHILQIFHIAPLFETPPFETPPLTRYFIMTKKVVEKNLNKTMHYQYGLFRLEDFIPINARTPRQYSMFRYLYNN